FLTSHGGNDFKEALLGLNKLGYGVDAFMLDAARFTPQSRQRLFVVGVLQMGVGADLRVCPYTSALRPAALAQFISRRPEINWNIRNLPEPPEGQVRLEEILEELPNNAPEWWGAERAEYLLEPISPRHCDT